MIALLLALLVVLLVVGGVVGGLAAHPVLFVLVVAGLILAFFAFSGRRRAP